MYITKIHHNAELAQGGFIFELLVSSKHVRTLPCDMTGGPLRCQWSGVSAQRIYLKLQYQGNSAKRSQWNVVMNNDCTMWEHKF